MDREFFCSQPDRAMLALSCNYVAFHNALARSHPMIAGRNLREAGAVNPSLDYPNTASRPSRAT